MPVGYPSIRVHDSNPTHHLWNNNGTWWIHFTIHFDHRKRRIRRSLKTRVLADAVVRRDQLLAKARLIGEVVPERRVDRRTGPFAVPADSANADNGTGGRVGPAGDHGPSAPSASARGAMMTLAHAY